MATNHDMKVDKMRFQVNKSAYWFVMLAVMFNMYFTIYVLNNVKNDFMIGAATIIMVVYLMVLFLAAEKVKIYSKEWSIACFGFAVFTIFIAYLPYRSFSREEITSSVLTYALVILAIQAVLLVFAGLVTFKRATALRAHVEAIGGEPK